MSKAGSRKKHPPRHRRPAAPLQTSAAAEEKLKQLLPYLIIAVLAAIPFTMAEYIEFHTDDPFDSGAYVYSAKHILDGAEIGVEEIPSARQGTLLVNMLGVWLFGYSETGPEIIQTIMQAVALVLMFVVTKKLYGTLPAAVCVIVASIYLGSPIIAKFGNVKEQYMIACMVLAVSCFCLHQLGGSWFLACLAGAFAIWAPLFKPTGVSGLAAIGLFVIAQPVLRNRSWKQTAADIGLLVAGASVAIAPVFIWIIGWNVKMELPYAFAWEITARAFSSAPQPAAGAGTYVARSRAIIPFSVQWPRVLRYYAVLILPIALATGSIIARLARMALQIGKKPEDRRTNNYDRFVLLFGLWWLGDMALVWVSPRSYEQYYLPLNASAAMLGGYIVALWWGKTKTAVLKTKWIVTGLFALVLMITMSWHVFVGISKSPHSGMKYPQRRRGYIEGLRNASFYAKGARGPWEVVAEYIRDHSTSDDKIYVWGWYPGIYVKAQRFSSSPRACTGAMHTPPPDEFSEMINNIVASFEKDTPKFIVDSRKNHIPLERPPHELWPEVPKGFMGSEKGGFLPPEQTARQAYDRARIDMLRQRFGDDEALRYQAMKPFQDFVMENYRIANKFGSHVLFERK